MNCWEFAKVVMDVARSETAGARMDTPVKQAALAHAHHCPHCAACLASEKSLSRGLRTVARTDDVLPVSAALEKNLLAAFRAQHAVPEVAAPLVREVATESPFALFFGRLRWALAGAAAMTLLIFAVARGFQPQAVNEPLRAKGGSPTPARVISPLPPTRETLVVPAPPEAEPLQASNRNNAPKQVKAKWPTARKGGTVTVDMGEFFVDEPEDISASEFLVFDYARTLPPADSTQLMRVQMPRERLAPLGLRLPQTVRDNGLVSADLLVGSDGVPRAIRVADR